MMAKVLVSDSLELAEARNGRAYRNRRSYFDCIAGAGSFIAMAEEEPI